MEENKNNQTSSMWMYIVAVVLVISAMLIIVFWIETPTSDLSSVACIANSTQLYVSTGCGYCEKQKQILGEDLSIFNITDCRVNPELCKGIKVVPTWIVNEEIYGGFQTMKDLREITGC